MQDEVLMFNLVDCKEMTQLCNIDIWIRENNH